MNNLVLFILRLCVWTRPIICKYLIKNAPIHLQNFAVEQQRPDLSLEIPKIYQKISYKKSIFDWEIF